MDTKELWAHCHQMGIALHAKSALASITEDEAKLVTESLRSRGTSQSRPARPAVLLPAICFASLTSPLRGVAGPRGVNPIQMLDSPPPPTLKAAVPDAPVVPSGLSHVADKDVEPYEPSNRPLSLGNALAIDSLQAQVAELGAIVESLIVRILDTSDSGAQFMGETSFCSLIDDAFDAEFFASLSADDLNTARMTRNRIVHRANGAFPTVLQLRQSRNTFVLAVLDLLEYCGESLKAEILSEFAQHFPRNKRMRQ